MFVVGKLWVGAVNKGKTFFEDFCVQSKNWTAKNSESMHTIIGVVKEAAKAIVVVAAI